MIWASATVLVILASAQEPLALRDAAALAQKQNPAGKAAAARTAAAALKKDQARSGLLPRLNYTESYQRSNNPVFVFSTLLQQRQFGEANFQIGPLNNPASVNSFHSQLSVDQTLYDAGLTRRQMSSAGLQSKLTAEEQKSVEMNLAAGAARAYFGVLLAEEAVRVARQAVTSAEADLRRAENVRSAGMATDVDVLSIQVHLAAMREQEIRRRSELEVARAALNEVLGFPLDAVQVLSTALQPLTPSQMVRRELEEKAPEMRPEARQAGLAVQLAETDASMARAAYFPRVSVRGALEADRGRFVTQGGGNWFAGVSLQWNLFNGYADRSRVRASAESLRASEWQKKQVDRALQLQVRRAWSEFTAATERIQVAEAAVAQAEESLRITRNRYEAGLATVTDLLRNQSAGVEASLRKLMAVHDQRVAAAMVELAAGSLTADSAALQ